MEITHREIQQLHDKVRKWKGLEEGTKKDLESSGQQYEIINSENSVTEAVAVAPVV
ncbi:hypothetical protein ACVRXQ_02895 [Streptococcus panodentis]|uniref:hypothetical protein n=1 Tax=Streptococcus panodentis TaxID=1581472 RepID=UPI001AE1CC79|nr:hypothetical protein [Streptococcus panodentis]